MSNHIDLIQKLFAKAIDAGTTEDEAALFMQKVQELLAKHNLDESVLNKKEVVEPIESEGFKVILPTSWFAGLANATAQLYFCGVTMNNGRKTYYFIGKKHNRVVAMNMFAYFMKTITRMSLERYKDQARRYQFAKGAALRLTVRIYLELEKVKAPIVSTVVSVPAIYDAESKAVKDHIASLNLKSARANKVKANNALIEGYVAANNISFNNQIGRQENSNLRLTMG